MHYSVLVIWDNPKSILEPFQEWGLNDLPIDLLEFSEEVSKEDFEKMSDEEKEKTKNYYDEHEWAYWYWSNPNGIWDWYEIWGRWAWMLSLKDISKKEEYPDINFSWGRSEKDKEEYKNSNKVDQAKMKDIDWEWMKKEKIDKLVKQFNDVKELFNWKIPKIEKMFCRFPSAISTIRNIPLTTTTHNIRATPIPRKKTAAPNGTAVFQ